MRKSTIEMVRVDGFEEALLELRSEWELADARDDEVQCLLVEDEILTVTRENRTPEKILQDEASVRARKAFFA